ncbi:MAG: hypothetical protein O9342_01055 [Beijerinckiaceae bacterium]|nr:hypothetical protein [Beijerinckiaceae bacterium]
MRSLLAGLAVACLSFLSSLPLAEAHEQRTGPRGGALVDAGSYHVELITRDKAVEIFVSDAQDKPLPANGFKALAILAVSGKSVRVTLEPAPDGSKLIGAAAESLPARVKGAVQLTGADGKTSTGRIN